jgi:transcriptional regulator with XRE-family HTH domain
MSTVGDGPGQVGALLRQHRKAAGLPQKELADAAGLSRRGISDLERGVRRRPYPATLRRLIAALGLSRAARAELLLAAAEDDVQLSTSRSSERHLTIADTACLQRTAC